MVAVGLLEGCVGGSAICYNLEGKSKRVYKTLGEKYSCEDSDYRFLKKPQAYYLYHIDERSTLGEIVSIIIKAIPSGSSESTVLFNFYDDRGYSRVSQSIMDKWKKEGATNEDVGKYTYTELATADIYTEILDKGYGMGKSLLTADRNSFAANAAAKEVYTFGFIRPLKFKNGKIIIKQLTQGDIDEGMAKIEAQIASDKAVADAKRRQRQKEEDDEWAKLKAGKSK